MKAVWNNQVIAERDKTVVVENNHYFPSESIKKEYLEASDNKTTCPWKGVASYYNLKVDGQVNANAAWYYAEPKSAAQHIKDHVAFWKGVNIVS